MRSSEQSSKNNPSTKHIQFDQQVWSLSASSTSKILEWIGKDALGVHQDIVKQALHKRDRHTRNFEEAWSHVLHGLCEKAHKCGSDLSVHFTRGSWRSYFAGLCFKSFYSSSSSWHHAQPKRGAQDIQPEDVLVTVDWTAADTHAKEAFEDELVQFIKNLEVLMRKHVEWWNYRLWVIYHLDYLGWLPEVRKLKPGSKMTFRLIQERTQIPVATIHAAVKSVTEAIREHYGPMFGPLPYHLLSRLTD